MIQDPTKKWTQSGLRKMSSDLKNDNFSRSLDFVDDMMRLKDYVFQAQSLQKTIHHYAISKEPISNDTYYYIQEEIKRFWSTCSQVSSYCIISMPEEIYKLKLPKVKTERLLALLRAVEKFIMQVRRNPQNNRDMMKIIKKKVAWKDK
jgi:hypothetical protein